MIGIFVELGVEDNETGMRSQSQVLLELEELRCTFASALGI